MAGDAMAALRQAIELGYDDFAHMATDSDLDALRDLPEFRGLMACLLSRRRAPS
jgi:hypothetical protein